jgi:hypothetical protein
MKTEYPDKVLRQLFTTHWKHIKDLEGKVYLGFEGKDKDSICKKEMSVAEALQHLINCLNITYSPDKFNHD